MPPQPFFSIITVTFNDRNGLESTLRSIAEQGIPHSAIEVIVVDGGTPGGVWDCVPQILLDRQQLQLVSEPDDGPYDAMNKGAARAVGEQLLFLNSGDRLAGPTVLADVVDRLQGALWAVAPGFHEHGGGANASTIVGFRHNWWEHALGRQPHLHQACFFSRTAFGILDGYNLAYELVADFDLLLRLGLIATPVQLDNIVCRYLGGGKSAVATAAIPRQLHAVRADRLQLTAAPRLASWTLAEWHTLRRRLREFLRGR